MTKVIPFHRPSKPSAAERGPGQIVAFPAAAGLARRDALRLMADAPELWMQFLHAHYDDVAEVQVAYRVSARAAEKWWQGVGGARIDKLLIALVSSPEALAWWLDRLQPYAKAA